MSLIEAITPVELCPCCGRQMRVYTQPGLLPWHADIELAECVNADCKAVMITLARGEHQRLTPQQINGYARARNAAKARL